MNKLFKYAVPVLSAASILVSCQESMKSLTARVFDTAAKQAVLMDARVAPESMPRTFQDGKPVDADIHWWCGGFFPGTLWEIYEYTGDGNIRDLAVKRSKEMVPLVDGKTDHDVGFMINCSVGNAWRHTGDSTWLPVYEKAAAKLAERFNPTVGCTKSWDWFGGSDFPVIIDNMMNLELLTKANKLFGTDSLLTIARTHANTTMKNHFRDDYTTWHVVAYDTSDGHVLFKKTAQGYSDESAWARGQAWALYGYTMMFREVGDEAYLSQAEKIAQMLLARLPEDGIPYWDFDSPEIPDGFRDASAGAIMASAFVELSTLTKDAALSKKCLKMAEKQLRELASERYLAPVGENGNFLLMHSVGSKPGRSEVDVPLTYADYYFLEALLRFRSVS